LNFSQDIQELNTVTNMTNESFSLTCSYSQPRTLLQVPSVTPLNKKEGDNGKVDVLGSMQMQSPIPTKRSKHRENSVDEVSSAREERIKAKRNLDGPGKMTSKSFLAFPVNQITTKITTIGFSLGSNLDKSIENLKQPEQDRLAEASKLETGNAINLDTEYEDVSDNDSNLGLDHVRVLRHLGAISIGYKTLVVDVFCTGKLWSGQDCMFQF
jgi:hypothetical protein